MPNFTEATGRQGYWLSGSLAITYPFVPVRDIAGIPASLTAGDSIELTGIVVPSVITWSPNVLLSIRDDGGTGSVLTTDWTPGERDDLPVYQLHVANAGTLVLTARVENGLAFGTDYTQDLVITVNASPTYTLVVSASVGGTVSGTASGSYAEGTTINIEAVPSSGYHFMNWAADGITFPDDAGNPLEFAMPDNAVSLTASFALDTPTVTGVIISPTNSAVEPGGNTGTNTGTGTNANTGDNTGADTANTDTGTDAATDDSTVAGNTASSVQNEPPAPVDDPQSREIPSSETPLDTAAPQTNGFAWWILAIIAAVAVATITIVIVRRRSKDEGRHLA
jgi:hypothetical protein